MIYLCASASPSGEVFYWATPSMSVASSSIHASTSCPALSEDRPGLSAQGGTLGAGGCLNPQLCKNLLALIRSLSDADLQLATLMLAHFDIVLVAFPLTNGPNVKQCLAMPLVRRRIGSPPTDLRPNGGGSPQPARRARAEARRWHAPGPPAQGFGILRLVHPWLSIP